MRLEEEDWIPRQSLTRLTTCWLESNKLFGSAALHLRGRQRAWGGPAAGSYEGAEIAAQPSAAALGVKPAESGVEPIERLIRHQTYLPRGMGLGDPLLGGELR